jgi:hypothetical protein
VAVSLFLERPIDLRLVLLLLVSYLKFRSCAPIDLSEV